MGFSKKEMKKLQDTAKENKTSNKEREKNLYFKINEELKKKSCFGGK